MAASCWLIYLNRMMMHWLANIKIGKYPSTFLISNFRHVLNVVSFLLGDSPASELYVPILQNSLFHLHWWCTLKLPLTPPTKMEKTACSRTWAHQIQTPRNHPKEITQLSTFQWPPSSESRKSKRISHMSLHWPCRWRQQAPPKCW